MPECVRDPSYDTVLHSAVLHEAFGSFRSTEGQPPGLGDNARRKSERLGLDESTVGLDKSLAAITRSPAVLAQSS